MQSGMGVTHGYPLFFPEVIQCDTDAKDRFFVGWGEVLYTILIGRV